MRDTGLIWVEIDGKAPEHNLRQLRAGAAPDVLACAVIKANAYGHDAVTMASLLPSAEWFGVNSLEEGQELREAGITRPIVVLGYVPLSLLASAVEAELSLTVYNRETVEALACLPTGPRKARIHVKVDTGTMRQGIFPEQLEDFLLLAKASPRILIEGLSTHYANIEDTLNHEYAEMQIRRFNEAVATADRTVGRLPYIHTACTAATILFSSTHFTMLRSGIGLYGLWPSRETLVSAREKGGAVADLRPVLSWKTRLAQIKTVPEGSYVGYGCSYKTLRKTLMGVLPIGYSDGYDRALGSRGHVLVRGRRAPLIGRICMNLCMIDLTDIPGVRLEDEVVLLGRDGNERITAETMAEWAGTINYEIVSRISPLLPRRVV
jgi:alanine racemase